VAHADMHGRPPIVPDGFPEGDWLLKKATELAIKDNAPSPILLGRHLVELGMKPGKQFGQLLDQCYEAQLDGAFTDLDSGKNYLKQLIESTPIQ